MNVQHGIFDNALFVLLLSIPLIEWKWTWPRYLKRLATGAPGVRASFYVSLMIGEWIPAACLLGWWAARARPWSGLLLGGTTSPLQIGIPRELRLWAGLTLAALLVGFLLAQRMAVLARPERMESVRPKLEFAEPLLPHTNVEHRLFWMVSLTAGECESLPGIPDLVFDGVDGTAGGGTPELGDLRHGSYLPGLGPGASHWAGGAGAGICGSRLGIAVSGHAAARGDGLELR